MRLIKAIKILKYLFPFLLLFQAFSLQAQNQENYSTVVGDYEIHHVVFNSSFLTPEIARIYGFTRGKDKALVNVAVTRIADGANSLGLEAEVKGEARNLFQQQTRLDFQAIEEKDAVYYLAPFDFDDEEIMHFFLEVLIPAKNGNRPISKRIKFSKKMYEN